MVGNIALIRKLISKALSKSTQMFPDIHSKVNYLQPHLNIPKQSIYSVLASIKPKAKLIPNMLEQWTKDMKHPDMQHVYNDWKKYGSDNDPYGLRGFLQKQVAETKALEPVREIYNKGSEGLNKDFQEYFKYLNDFDENTRRHVTDFSKVAPVLDEVKQTSLPTLSFESTPLSFELGLGLGGGLIGGYLLNHQLSKKKTT